MQGGDHETHPRGLAAMTRTVASHSEVWSRVQLEAETAVAGDPVFGGTLSASVLNHAGFGEVVAHQIGERLSQTSAERAQLVRIASEAFLAAPDLVEAASLG